MKMDDGRPRLTQGACQILVQSPRQHSRALQAARAQGQERMGLQAARAQGQVNTRSRLARGSTVRHCRLPGPRVG